jgi:hypothetical protein
MKREEEHVTRKYGERAISTTRVQCESVGANDCKCSRDQLLYMPLKHGGARVNNFLVTHPMTDQCCLASAFVRRAH